MQCQHCRQSIYEVCLNCDSHIFEIGMTIRNDSAKASLKERKQLIDEKNAEIKKCEEKAGKFKRRVAKVLAIVAVVGLSAVVLYARLKLASTPPAGNETPVTRVIPFDPEERFGPHGHSARDFSIEERRDVTINVSAECQNCFDGYLDIFLLDENNYRKFESDLPYDSIKTGSDIESFVFCDPLDKGRYYIVLQNGSLNSEVVALKVNASLSYK